MPTKKNTAAQAAMPEAAAELAAQDAAELAAQDAAELAMPELAAQAAMPEAAAELAAQAAQVAALAAVLATPRAAAALFEAVRLQRAILEDATADVTALSDAIKAMRNAGIATEAVSIPLAEKAKGQKNAGMLLLGALLRKAPEALALVQGRRPHAGTRGGVLGGLLGAAVAFAQKTPGKVYSVKALTEGAMADGYTCTGNTPAASLAAAISRAKAVGRLPLVTCGNGLYSYPATEEAQATMPEA